MFRRGRRVDVRVQEWKEGKFKGGGRKQDHHLFLVIK